MFLEWLGLLTLIFLLETREWLLEKGRIRSVAGWTQTWITVPQLWQCLEFFLYSVQCSRYKARQCLVFIYEWIHLAACEMMVRQVCVWERERERKGESKSSTELSGCPFSDPSTRWPTLLTEHCSSVVNTRLLSLYFSSVYFRISFPFM